MEQDLGLFITAQYVKGLADNILEDIDAIEVGNPPDGCVSPAILIVDMISERDDKKISEDEAREMLRDIGKVPGLDIDGLIVMLKAQYFILSRLAVAMLKLKAELIDDHRSFIKMCEREATLRNGDGQDLSETEDE